MRVVPRQKALVVWTTPAWIKALGATAPERWSPWVFGEGVRNRSSEHALSRQDTCPKGADQFEEEEDANAVD